MAYACRIEADSVSPAGKRLTTFVVTYPRMVHSELLTHRMLSRCSSSSRAIPIAKMIEAVLNDPVMPVYWGKNQSGMQAHEELSIADREVAEFRWLLARHSAVEHAHRLIEIGAHKQIVNRILEPWMWITVIVSATEWDNFFRLRCHPDAQPEIQKIAYMIKEAYEASTPVLSFMHTPFYRPDQDTDIVPGQLMDVCTARCARVSYLNHDGQRSPHKDIELCESLQYNGHWSPFEHCAHSATDKNRRSGNFIGWLQFREIMDTNFIKVPGR